MQVGHRRVSLDQGEDASGDRGENLSDNDSTSLSVDQGQDYVWSVKDQIAQAMGWGD